MRWIQGLLFAIGFGLLGYCGAAWYNAGLRQAQGSEELERVLAAKQHAVPAPPAGAFRIVIPRGGLVGKVEIPALHLSDIVFQGTDAEILGEGVGHVDSSSLPGQGGNLVLAAHRDSYFRSLRNIQKGDKITVTGELGSRTYRVDSTEIVKPTDVGVLNQTATPTLTLITCYPFNFIGHAPKRFIVRAIDISSPNSAPSEQLAQAARLSSLPGEASGEQPANMTYVFKASR
jgi:sortase A